MARSNAIPSGNVYSASPTQSIQQILDANVFASGDVIMVTGVVAGNVTITAADSGVTIIGAPGSQITGNVSVTGNNVSLQRLSITGNVAFTGGDRSALRESNVSGAVTIAGGTGHQLSYNTISTGGVAIGSNSDAAVVRNNHITGGTNGIAIGVATNISIRDNTLSGGTTGIRVQQSSTGEITGNKVAATATALDLDATFTGLIGSNRFSGASVGVRYDFATLLNNNDIDSNVTGVVVSFDSTTNGLGYVAGSQPNRIFSNTTGVALSGRMQIQRISNNTVGVSGSGQLLGLVLELANVIEGNTTGINISGTVQFQRISNNGVGILAGSGQLIAHNIFNGNTTGAQVVGKTDTRIISNTFYTQSGDNIRVTGTSRQTEVRNNILWTANGYDLFVANDSTTGFFSDYNTLYTTGTGKVGYWSKDFTDILDWQEDIYQFDLNSIGTTSINPRQAEPRFVNAAWGDFRLHPQVAGQRFTSPTIDGGDPKTDLALPGTFTNLLTNPSFESGLTGWTALPNGEIQSLPPSPIPFDGATYFKAGGNPTTSLEQIVNLSSQLNATQLSTLDAGGLAVAFGARARSATETPRDKGTLTITFLTASDIAIGQPIVVRAANVDNRWELLGSQSYLPASARKIVFRYEAVRQTGATNDVFLDGAFVSVFSNNLIPDMGAYGNALTDMIATPHLVLRSPDLYKDWERNKPIDIRWDSYGNSQNSAVVIELLQDTAQGPKLLTTITTGTPDNGSYTWIAGNSGIDFGTKGLRIQLSLATNRAVLDRSTEAFATPENTNTFFVNDNLTAGDQYTTAIGSNRNTGKLASSPKPYPNNVTRIYSLGANQSLTIDTGDYAMISPFLISNILGTGDDEGFLMQGSSTGTSTLRHANPLTVAPVVELNTADFMTLRNLSFASGSYGLYVRNQSTNFVGSYLKGVNNTVRGFHIDTGSTVLGLDHLLADGNLGGGIYVNASLVSLTDSVFSNNRSYGIQLHDTGPTLVEGNEVLNNIGNGVHGVYISNSVGGTLVFGNADLTLGRGNRIHDNAASGIVAIGQVNVVGNLVYNHFATSQTGITVNSGATAKRNIVRDNYYGIYSNGGEISENRSYRNLDAGIYPDFGTQVLRNVVYSNAIGIRGQSSYSGNLVNNLIYGNSLYGVLFTSSGSNGGSPSIVNNTVYQPLGDAIRLQSNSRNVNVRNNVLWVNAGYDLNIAGDSQTGFQSDYNNLFVTGTGMVATWQNVDRPTLSAWRTTAFTDANSLSIDPQFVNLLGADGLLGYSSAVNDGRDDDFHEKSLNGSFHSVSFAPVATANGLGLPAWLSNPANPVADGATSPLIDRGSPSDSFASEPAPNGGFINIGAFGGTNQASISPLEYVTVTTPDGGEVWPQSQVFPIRWRSHNTAATTFQIELYRNGNPTPITTIATNAPNSGLFNWTVPSSVAPATDYIIRVTRNDAPFLFDVSNTPFTISAPINLYYVNDNTVQSGDITTAVGVDTNSGLDPNNPKSSISAILNAYVMKPGDTILVDAGTYNLSTTLILNAAASGIRIEGYHDPAFPTRGTTFNRGNTSLVAIELQNADNITFDHLTITGGLYGIYASTTSDSD
ncbi:MAG: right-handed parallel beta-helix repeat-containing protein, partial [Pirellula sp.]